MAGRKPLGMGALGVEAKKGQSPGKPPLQSEAAQADGTRAATQRPGLARTREEAGQRRVPQSRWSRTGAWRLDLQLTEPPRGPQFSSRNHQNRRGGWHCVCPAQRPAPPRPEESPHGAPAFPPGRGGATLRPGRPSAPACFRRGISVPARGRPSSGARLPTSVPSAPAACWRRGLGVPVARKCVGT